MPHPPRPAVLPRRAAGAAGCPPTLPAAAALLGVAALAAAAVAAPRRAAAQANSFITTAGALGASPFTAGFGDYTPRTDVHFVPAAGLAVADPGQPAAAGVRLFDASPAGGIVYLNSGVTNLGGLTANPCGNGAWDGAQNGRGAYVVGQGGGVARFTFASLVGAVGFTLNYLPNCGATAPTLRLLGDGGALLATYDVGALAPFTARDPVTGFGLLNAGEFVGALRATADVRSIEVTSGDVFVLDDLRYTTAAPSAGAPSTVPEPAPLALCAAGAAVLAGGAAARRREG